MFLPCEANQGTVYTRAGLRARLLLHRVLRLIITASRSALRRRWRPYSLSASSAQRRQSFRVCVFKLIMTREVDYIMLFCATTRSGALGRHTRGAERDHDFYETLIFHTLQPHIDGDGMWKLGFTFRGGHSGLFFSNFRCTFHVSLPSTVAALIFQLVSISDISHTHHLELFFLVQPNATMFIILTDKQY